MSCAICWDSMDMEEYNDENESTETCFKLDCGHAFHTKCIVLALQKTKHSCPSCNKEKAPLEELEIVGLASKLFNQAIRDPSVSELRKEFKIATAEYQLKLREHRKRCTEAVQQISEEMRIADHRTYYLKTLETVKREVKSKVEEMGPKYIGAALFKKEQWNAPLIESLIIPGYRQFRWKYYRIKHPRFSCPVLNMMKNK